MKSTNLFLALFILIGLFLYILNYGLGAFLQQLINGIQKGSMYALIALGYTLVYGIIKLINFAHGDIFMVGVYLACFSGNLAAKRGFGILLPLVTAMIGCAILGILIERIAYKPLRTKPRLTMLITALGVSLFLENFLSLDPQNLPFPLNHIVFGPQFRPFPQLIEERNYDFFGIIINNIKLIDLCIAILMMALLNYIVKYTLIGKAMRATAFNKDVARLMGINIDSIILFTFALGSALAGVAGTLYGLTYGVLQSPCLGMWPGVVAFVAAVIGGIGNIPGAMLGGFLIGIVETMATSINSNLGFGVTFLTLILVLLFRPTGLIGRSFIEKI